MQKRQVPTELRLAEKKNSTENVKFLCELGTVNYIFLTLPYSSTSAEEDLNVVKIPIIME